MKGEYYQALLSGDIDKADELRRLEIPNKLVKFFQLDDSEMDEKRLGSLEKNELWLSNTSRFNDPYELKGMVIDREKLEDSGCSEADINTLQELLNFSDYGVSCLSANPVDYLPMWAYYTNNHRGFCVEYEVMSTGYIWEVSYEAKRIKLASIAQQFNEALETKNENKESARKAQFYGSILIHCLSMKSSSWSHEKEYRVIRDIRGKGGMCFPVAELGLKPARIIAGVNCTEGSIDRINAISNNLGLGNVYVSRLSEEEYSLEIAKYGL